MIPFSLKPPKRIMSNFPTMLSPQTKQTSLFRTDAATTQLWCWFQSVLRFTTMRPMCRNNWLEINIYTCRYVNELGSAPGENSDLSCHCCGGIYKVRQLESCFAIETFGVYWKYNTYIIYKLHNHIYILYTCCILLYMHIFIRYTSYFHPGFSGFASFPISNDVGVRGSWSLTSWVCWKSMASRLLVGSLLWVEVTICGVQIVMPYGATDNREHLDRHWYFERQLELHDPQTLGDVPAFAESCSVWKSVSWWILDVWRFSACLSAWDGVKRAGDDVFYSTRSHTYLDLRFALSLWWLRSQLDPTIH